MQNATNPMSESGGKPGRRGLARILCALGFSWQGVRAAWRGEAAFRQEVVLFVLLFPLALWLGESWVEIALMQFSLGVVLVAELLNSALEALVDRVGTEHHPLSGQAKDMGSAAVLLAIGLALMVWGGFLIRMLLR